MGQGIKWSIDIGRILRVGVCGAQEGYESDLRHESATQIAHHFTIGSDTHDGREDGVGSSEKSFHCSAQVCIPITREAIFGIGFCQWRRVIPSFANGREVQRGAISVLYGWIIKCPRVPSWFQCHLSVMYFKKRVIHWCIDTIFMQGFETREYFNWLQWTYCAMWFWIVQAQHDRRRANQHLLRHTRIPCTGALIGSKLYKGSRLVDPWRAAIRDDDGPSTVLWSRYQWNVSQNPSGWAAIPRGYVTRGTKLIARRK